MVLKDCEWIGMNKRDTLISAPLICNSCIMTLMYREFLVHIPITLP
jgi:hypothetical protein